MTVISLDDKAVDIKGKKYVLVSDRILALAEQQEPYCINTDAKFYPEEKMWVVKATLKWEDQEYNGHAQEIIGDGYINKTSALENCETSAVGRACAMAGIGVIDSIASVDEINKANARATYKAKEEKPWLNDIVKENIVKTYEMFGKKEGMKTIKAKYRVNKEKEAAINKIFEECLEGGTEELDF